MKNIYNGKRYISTNMEANKRVVLIGAGNVATHLGLALQAKGHDVVQVYSRTDASASELASRLGCGCVTSLDWVCTDAEIYIVALKDAVLRELIPAIVKGREGALFVHTAGSIPMDVWKGHAGHYGVLYPMQTFSKASPVDLETVSFFVEANGGEELQILKNMASAFTHKVYEATSDQRSCLHIAAVFICNFTNHMYALGAYLLEKNGLPFEAMLPLIEETARKVHELSPKDAQTGPAIRGDENVMRRHLDMLSDETALQELYKKISKSIQTI